MRSSVRSDVTGITGLLFDTNVLVMSLVAPARLPSTFVGTMERAYPNVFVSVASLWEIAIKASIGKLQAIPPNDELVLATQNSGFRVLPITPSDALSVRELVHHHRDPFDRLLVACARIRNLTLTTTDRTLARYDVPVVMAR
jgi:PIN domain nuclease of toxin-antitoxin system